MSVEHCWQLNLHGTGVAVAPQALLLSRAALQPIARCGAHSFLLCSQVVAGRRHVGIMGLELVGNYAVR